MLLRTLKVAQGHSVADPTDVQRRLAAVFAADVEGYSRLMGADEVGTPLQWLEPSTPRHP